MKRVDWDEYLTHTTKSGDRWDLLAFEYYGNAFATEVLLEANPQYAGYAILSAGLSLIIPLLASQDLTPEPEAAVPWR